MNTVKFSKYLEYRVKKIVNEPDVGVNFYKKRERQALRRFLPWTTRIMKLALTDREYTVGRLGDGRDELSGALFRHIHFDMTVRNLSRNIKEVGGNVRLRRSQARNVNWESAYK